MATSTIVVDANVAIWAVLPMLAKVDPSSQFREWREQRSRLVGPSFWLAEGVTGIRQAVHSRLAPPDVGRLAVESLFRLGIEVIRLDYDLCTAAYGWATRLRQAQAYDGFYLALAEDLGADLWTADGNLARGARQIGITWVHLIE